MIGKIIVTFLILLASIGSSSAATFNCSNCTQCSALIQNATPGDTVRLMANISDCDGDCILFNDSDGITFDGNSHIIEGDYDYNGDGIYLSSYSNNNIITNLTISGFLRGIFAREASYNMIKDVNCSDNLNYGIYLYHSPFNTLSNLILNDKFVNNYGIFFDVSPNTTLNNSYIVGNFLYGLNIRNSENLVIYNNYFGSNGGNIYFSGTIYPGTWNVTNRTGPNIFGGPFIGGNYWSDYSGWHTRPDGFGDEPYDVNTNNTDYLPLVIDGEPDMWIRNDGYDIEVGETWEYLVTCRNGSNMDVNCTNLTWLSSNETIATVVWSADDAAIITGNAVGVVNITVTGCGNLTDTVAQNVTGICGDVDCDDSVTMIDVIETYYRVIDPEYPLASEWAADVDGDSAITMNDVIEIYYRVIDPSYPLNCSD